MTLNTNVGRLPLTIDEIDTAWLSDALSTHVPGTKVHDFEIVDIRHGFTTLLRIRMALNDVGRQGGIPDTVMLKGGFEDFTRGAARAYAVKGYSLEVVSYREIWPVLGLNVPTCYFADMELDVEPDQQQTIIIMEDLLQRGVTFSDGLKPESYEQVDRRLSSLAKAHAKTWDSPELRSGGRYHGVLQNGVRLNRMHMEVHGYIDLGDDERSRQRSEYRQMPPFLTPEGWETMWAERMSQNAAASHHFRDFEWNRKAMAHLEELSDQLPNCVLHGDTHLGNHFQEPDGTPGFFDPMPRREPAYFELAYTITTGLDPYDRRKWERALVGHYLAELGRNGVKLDFNQTMYYYALFLHAGYIWFIINDPVWQTSAFNTVHVFRFCSAMMDNGTKELMDAAFREKPLRSQSTVA